MAEFAPLRTGQLVVRYRTPWRRKVILGAGIFAACLGVIAAFEWGRYRGGFDHLAAINEQRVLTARSEALTAENHALRAGITSAELAREVNHQGYADMEKNLSELQAQVLKQREELAFYRGIVAPEDGLGSLRVQRLEIMPSGAERQYRLRLVLVQSLRQEALASGSAEIEITGVKDTTQTRVSLADLTASTTNRLMFSFRYFQNMEQDVLLPEGFEPTSVEIELKPAKQNAIKQSFPWQVQTVE
jgi:hypothetical protein